MINPFEKVKIELELSINQLEILLRLISSSIPDSRDKEESVLRMYEEIQYKLEQLKN